MKINQKKWWILISIIVAFLILITLFAAPSSNKLVAGSTFNKSPNGYAAWYQYMLEQEVKIARWQKPFSDLKYPKNQVIFLKILPTQISKFSSLSDLESKWIEQGNTMVILGVEATATSAPFTTNQSYQDLNLKIATTRRKQSVSISILQDNYGSIVWQENMGQGKVIYAVTPYIAANAYQNNSDNYQFLAELVNQNSLILVDEYLHGYKDPAVIQQEKQSKRATILSYFSKTVWLPIAIQTMIILLIAIASGLRRFGQLNVIAKTQLDNSQAYIQALAAVLEKAECSDFMIKTIAKDEKLKLQQSLGLGTGNISDPILIRRWEQATGKKPEQLAKLLRIAQGNSRLNDSELIKWLKQWQQLY